MPIVKAYNGPLPEDWISFEERNKRQYSLGIHCYMYDYKIEPIWRSPSISVPCLQKYACVIAPDFSVFVDQPRAINVWNIYRNRWVSSYWQCNDITVIPSASWGTVDSFEYCFDGLPDDSIIAIGHIVSGRDRDFKMLYRYGVEALIEKKHPTCILVYGAPLDFSPEVDIVYYEGKLQKLRNNESNRFK